MRASRTSELIGDIGEVASFDAAGVYDRDHNTEPPNGYQYFLPSSLAFKYLCAISSSGRAWHTKVTRSFPGFVM